MKRGLQWKRWLSALLALAMVCSILPAGVLAAGPKAAVPTSGSGEADRIALTATDLTDSAPADVLLENLKTALDPSVVQDAEILAPDSEVDVIIELDTKNLVELKAETADANVSMQSFLTTEEAKEQLSVIENLKFQVMDEMETLGVPVETTYTYTTVTSGFAATVPYGKLEEIRALEGVRRVTRSTKWYLDDPTTAEDLTKSVNAAAAAYENTSAYQGEGMVIAIIDTGLDYDHEAFANAPAVTRIQKETLDAFVTNPEYTVVASWMKQYRYTDVTADDLYISPKVPFAFDYADVDLDAKPRQDAVENYGNDHGTHVAGISAGKTVDSEGNVTFSGAAPEAQLAIFKVFSDNSQGADTTEILAAVNDAVILDVDVINMSLGQSGGFTDEQGGLIDQIYNMVAEAGIMLCVSAGNSYTSSYYGIQGDYAATSNPDNGIVGSPSTYAAPLSVASVNATATAVFEAGGSKVAYNSVPDHDFAAELLNGKDSVNLEYVAVPGLGEASDYEGLDVAGKVALVQRGDISFNDKQLNAHAAGAVACIIYNNRDGYLLNMQVDDYRIPTASISLTDGQAMIQAERKSVTVSTGGSGYVTMSDFSSWGPTPSLELKPEITAPGGNIYSALPYDNAYGYMSGTSMAAPYLSGVAAALKQKLNGQYASMEPADRKILEDRLLMSTAAVLADEGNNGLPYSPRRQGAGLVDLNAALNTPAYLYVRGQERPKLELGDDPKENGIYHLSFHVKNMTGVPVSYDLNTVVMTESVTADGQFIAQRAKLLEADTSAVTVTNGKLSGTSVTVPANGDTIITVKVVLTEADKTYLRENFENGMYVEGFVELTAASSNAVDLSIPYLAFFGDWTKAPIFDADAFSGETAAMFATEVYGQYGDLYVMPLGRYLLTLPEGVETPAPSLDKIAISGGLNNNIHTLYPVYAGMLRGAANVAVTITDQATDEVFVDWDVQNVRKTYFSGVQMIPGVLGGGWAGDATLGNNARLVYNADAYLDYADPQQNLKNHFSFEFSIDAEAPRVNNLDGMDFYRGEDGRMYLDVEFVDNRYLMAANLYSSGYGYSQTTGWGDQPQESYYDYFVPIVNEDGSDVAPNTPVTITFDVTDVFRNLNNSSFFIVAYDYTMNVCMYKVTVTEVPMEQIILDQTETTMKINQVLQLNATILPEDTTNLHLAWTSSNPAVAMVHPSTGEVTALKTGTATITASAEQTAGVSASCTVTVTEEALPPVTMTEIQFNTNHVDLQPSATYSVWMTGYEPYNATSLDVTWSSSDPTVATVAPRGEEYTQPLGGYEMRITAVGSGSCEIRATANDGEAVGICTVTVADGQGAFNVDEETHTLISYSGNEMAITVPDGIVHIGDNAFANNANVQNINLPETVETIGDNAFGNCFNLKSVNIPASATVWGTNVFNGCTSLERVALPQGLASIPGRTFYNCQKLENIVIPDSVTAIGAQAFWNCRAFTEIVIPDSVNVLDAAGGQFQNCANLASVDLSENITSLPADCFNNTGFTDLPDLKNVASLGNYCFANLGNATGTVHVPASVKSLGNYCFAFGKMTTVDFAGPIDEMGGMIFRLCGNLTGVTGNLNQIGPYFFDMCYALTEFQVPDAVKAISAYAFNSCYNLKSIQFGKNSQFGDPGFMPAGYFGYPDNNTIVDPFTGCSSFTGFYVEAGSTTLRSDDSGVLYNADMTVLLRAPKSITSVAIPDTVVTIAPSAFYQSTVQDVTFPVGLKTVSDTAFALCSRLQSIDLPDTVEVIGSYAFRGCSKATAVHLSTVLTSVGEGAFQECSSVKEMAIPQGITEIPTDFFRGCSGLTTLEIPEGVTTINRYAFYGCSKLEKIILPQSLTTAGDYIFYGCSSATEINTGSLTEIDRYAFYNCSKAVKLVLSDDMTTITDSAFYNCQSLTDIVWPSQLKTVGNSAFSNCYWLHNLDLSGTQLESISGQAFSNAYGAQVLKFPDTLRVIETSAFASLNAPASWTGKTYRDYGCETPITVIELGANVERVSSQGSFVSATAFTTCPYLERFVVDPDNAVFTTTEEGYLVLRSTGEPVIFPEATTADSFTIPETLTAISAGMFQGNTTLKKVYIHGGVTSVGRMAFYNSSVEEVYFEDSRYGIVLEDSAFSGCSKLKTVELPYGMTSIGTTAFALCTALEAVNLPDTVVSLGASAFTGCTNLSQVKLPDALEELRTNVFANCAKLTELTLPRAMTVVTLNSLNTALLGCTGLENIWVDSDNIAFRSVDGVLYSYNGKNLVLYPAAHPGSEYIVPEGVTRIGIKAFENNLNLEKVTLPSTLERVGANAFLGCTNLKTYLSFAETAPLLESSKVLSNGDMQYGNFTGYYNEYKYGPNGYGVYQNDLGLTLYRPAGAAGYDSYAWIGFFGQPNCQSLEMTPDTMFTVGDLTIAEGENRTAQLTWTEPGQTQLEHVTYEISRAVATQYRSDDQETWIYGEFEQLATGLEETAYTDATTLDFGLTYAYRVATVTDSGETGPAAIGYLYIDADAENADEQAALAVIAAIEALKPVDQLTAADAERVAAVAAMYEALTDGQKAMVANYPDLLQAQDHVAAACVTEAIAQLPAVEELTLADAGAVEAARAAYEALTDAQKALVLNEADLQLAESKLQQLRDEAAAVEASIDLIPTVENLTLADAEGIEAIRAAYDALTEEQKALVSNYDELLAAEAKLEELRDAIAAVEELIAQLPAPKDLTLADAEAVEAARAAYEALTEEQKVLVSNYEDLVAAETRIRQLEADANWENPYQDVAESVWYYDAVQFVTKRGLMVGVDNARFNPTGTMSRGMAVTVLYRLAGSPSVEGLQNPYRDVAPGRYYTDAIIWASSEGIVNGVGTGRFNPTGNVTREQMVTIFYRYAKAAGYDVSGRTDLSTFPDEGSISDYAREAMSWAIDTGLIRGTTSGPNTPVILAPRKNLTRAEGAMMFMNYILIYVEE